jgi:hypothetical protein
MNGPRGTKKSKAACSSRVKRDLIKPLIWSMKVQGSSKIFPEKVRSSDISSCNLLGNNKNK